MGGLLWFVIIYWVISVGIGLWAARRVHNARDFAIAGRSLPMYIVTATVFATWFGSETVLGIPATNIDIGGDLAALATAGDRPVIVGPDSESRPWVQAAADRLGADWAVFDKQRLGDREVRMTLDPTAPVAGRATLLLDDICSSGGTLAQAIHQLRQAGAASVDVAVAHALFDPDTLDRLREAGARRVLSSDSIPHPTNALDLTGRLAEALRNEIAA